MSMTTGPSCLTDCRASIVRSTSTCNAFYFLVVSHLRAVFELAADRAVAAGNHFIAGLDAGFDFHVSVVRNSSGHFGRLRFAAPFQKHDLGQFLALFSLRRLFLTLVHVIGVVVTFIARSAFHFFPLDFLRAQIAVAGSNRHRLHRHCDRVLHHVGLDVSRAAQTRPQKNIFPLQINFHFEIGDFFLRATAGRLSGVPNLRHRPFEFAIAIGVDFHVCLVANFHIRNVILVYIDHGLHARKIGHAHHLSAGELSCGDDALAQFAVQDGHRSIDRRINRRLRKLIARLA